MGRAIDMEKDIDMLKTKVEKLENVVRGMTHTMEEKKEKTDGKKKTNNEGNGKSSRKSNKRKSVSSSKNSKS